MSKRGASHVEVILAFVIFVVAVGFALYLFNPGQGDRIVESSLDYAFREIVKNTSTQVETFSVVIHHNGNGPLAFDFQKHEGNTRAERYDGTSLSSSNDGTHVFVEDNWNEGEFIFVKFSEDFPTNVTGTATHNGSAYEISSSTIKEVLSEKRVLVLNETYYSDYLDLKADDGFNLPDRVNFGFTLSFADGTEIKAERPVPAGLEIFSQENRIEVMRLGGSIEYADLVVKVW